MILMLCCKTVIDALGTSCTELRGGGGEREREREIHFVHSASLAYEDATVFMRGPFAARQ